MTDPRPAALAEARYRRDCDGSRIRDADQWDTLPDPIRGEYLRQADRDVTAMDEILLAGATTGVPDERTG